MRSFEEIYAIAADRKGGPDALEAMLSKPADRATLLATPDSRWLSMMAKCLFQAGFNWKVVDAKWDGFEEAFEGFDPHRVAFYHDEELDRLLSDKRVIRNGAKLSAVIANANFICELADEHGSTAHFFADWPREDYVGLLDVVAKRGSRLGSVTGQRFLRWMGRDGFILSQDVVARLIAEGVITKSPTSKKDLAAVQTAFNDWAEESGRSLTEISQVLSRSF